MKLINELYTKIYNFGSECQRLKRIACEYNSTYWLEGWHPAAKRVPPTKQDEKNQIKSLCKLNL